MGDDGDDPLEQALEQSEYTLDEVLDELSNDSLEITDIPGNTMLSVSYEEFSIPERKEQGLISGLIDEYEDVVVDCYEIERDDEGDDKHRIGQRLAKETEDAARVVGSVENMEISENEALDAREAAKN